MKKPTSVINNPVDIILPLVDGQVATDGIQYSTAVACATGSDVNIISKTIDFGDNIRPLKIEVGLTQKFVGGNGSLAGSLMYYWQGRVNALVPSGQGVANYQSGWCALSPTISKGIGTLVTVEDTLSGDLSVATFGYFPIDIRLVTRGAPSISGYLKNASYVRVIGNIIPGT